MGWLRRGGCGIVVIVGVSCAGAPTNAPTVPRIDIPAAERLQCDQRSAATPLIFSLAPEQRTDIEALLKQTIVMVRYECDKLTVFPDCTVDGSYGYVSVTPREQVLSLSSELEVRANLPLQSSSLLARVAPEFASGGRLDMAFAITGQQTSVLRTVARSQLKGECSAATHFVRGASLGAFAIAIAHGAPQSIGDVFRGASTLIERDGSLEACRVQHEDNQRVTGCAAPLRLDLQPLTDDASQVSAGDEERAAPRCPGGTQLQDDGKCTATAAEAPHVCRFDDHSDCEKQCQGGSPGSCALLGRNYELGRGVTKDLARAEELYNRACRAGSPPGCGRLGAILVERPGTHDEGLDLLRKACKDGFFQACKDSLARLPATQINQQAELARRGCDGGNAESCWSLGECYRDGIGGVGRDAAEATRYLKLACDGGALLGCSSYTDLVDPGDVATPETPRALALLATACDRSTAAACGRLAVYYGRGKGVPADFTKSMALIERACVGGDISSCLVAGLSYERGTGHPKDLVKAAQYLTRSCESGDVAACMASAKLRARQAQNSGSQAVAPSKP